VYGGGGGGFDAVAGFEALAGAGAQGGAGLRGEPKPAHQQSAGSREGVGFDETGAVGGDLGGDVHRVGDQHRGGAGEGFGHGDAEVFLMGGEHEGLGARQGAHLSSPWSMPVQTTESAIPSLRARTRISLA
jgi:hypothetical protein